MKKSTISLYGTIGVMLMIRKMVINSTIPLLFALLVVGLGAFDYTYAENVTQETYAVFDDEEKTLTFFCDDEGRYSSGQADGSKTYFTDFIETDDVPWGNVMGEIEIVFFADKVVPISTANWFGGAVNLYEIDSIEKLDTSQVTDMSKMFYQCELLQDVDLTHFSTENVTDMSYMFSQSGIMEADFTSFDFGNTLTMSNMFNGCALAEVELKGAMSTSATNPCMDRLFFGSPYITKVKLTVSGKSRVY